MANHKSALKRHRQNVKQAEMNNFYRTTMRTLVKRARLALDGGDKAAAVEAVGSAAAYLDRVAVKGIIHKNKAARLKSRLSKQLAGL